MGMPGRAGGVERWGCREGHGGGGGGGGGAQHYQQVLTILEKFTTKKLHIG